MGHVDDQPAPPPPSDDDRPAPEGPWAEEAVAEALERIGRGLVEVAQTAVGLAVLGINRVNALRSRTAQARPDDQRG